MAIINALTENGPSSLVVSIQTHNRGEFYVAVAEKRRDNNNKLSSSPEKMQQKNLSLKEKSNNQPQK
jgi:hypothetical protein